MNRKKDLLILLIATSIVIIIWVIASIVQTKPSEGISSDLQTALDPLTPTFDQKTLDQIDSVGTAPLPTPSNTPLPITTPTPTPPILTPNPIASPSANPPASSSGGLSTITP